MLIIGLDRFKEPKNPGSMLTIVLGERRIGIQINRRISRQGTRAQPYRRTE